MRQRLNQELNHQERNQITSKVNFSMNLQNVECVRWTLSGFSSVTQARTQTFKNLSVQKLFLLLLLVAFSFATPLSAARAEEELNENPVQAQARASVQKIEAGGTFTLKIQATVAKGFHAYADKFSLRFEEPEGLKSSDLKISPLHEFVDTSGAKKQGIENKAEISTVIEVPISLAGKKYKVSALLKYQACSKSVCLFPKTIPLNFDLEVENHNLATSGSMSKSTDSTSSPNPNDGSKIKPESDGLKQTSAQKDEFSQALGRGVFSALLFVFIAGFLTSLTPCVYPMIPITLAILGARAKNQTKLKSFSLSFVYVLGIASTYSALGVMAASTGSLFGSALSNIYVVTAIALLFVTMGLSMYGLFEIQVPAFIRDRAGQVQGGSGYSGAFFTGLIAGLVASPCIGPVLVTILTYIAQTQNRMLGFLFLFTFAMGMGILFMVLGTSSSLIGKVPKSGHWMDFIKFIFGTTMVGMALYYIAPIYPKWLFHALLGLSMILIASSFGAFEANDKLSPLGRIRKGLMLVAMVFGMAFGLLALADRLGLSLMSQTKAEASTPGTEHLAFKKYSNTAFEAALKSKRPIMIDFFAEWCVACKELEKFTFTDKAVQAESANFELLQVDATEDFEGLDLLKKKFNVVGLPTMIFFNPQGIRVESATLTGFEEAPQFLQRMQSAK